MLEVVVLELLLITAPLLRQVREELEVVELAVLIQQE
jgi:hypothetical protein